MIYGPHFTHINRLHPIDKDRSDDQQDASKKKKVLHQGRSWAEKDEDLPVQPSVPEPVAQRRSTVLYADRLLMEKAKKYFQGIAILEEKVAQLFFLECDADYDTVGQREIEILLQTWQIGGILFKKGEYRRQMYLVERFQEVSKTPLLFANDFLHGLSFYLQGDTLKTGLSNQHFMDLGKAVMVQNRRMGVHIQLDNERKSSKSQMTEVQARSFRKGIREAQGIVGKQKSEKLLENFSHTYKSALPYLSIKESPFITSVFSDQSIQESIGYKVTTFLEVAQDGVLEEILLNGYREHYDIFLLSRGNIVEAIRTICKLVRSGKIREDELDRRVMKILIIKALFFKS